MNVLDRRTLIGAALALGACESAAQGPPVPVEIGPLRAAAPFPLGVCAQVSHIEDPEWARLAATHFSQLTPEWEMKMEYVVQPDGGFRFDRADRLAAFARAARMRLYCTTLIWYAQRPEGFEKLDESRTSFGRAYDNYITAMVGRYRGQAAGWDVVNEAVAEDGRGWRESLWASRLGDFDHMRRAFEVARAADPDAVLFLNDYNLETIPRKLDTFQRLVERLLNAGVPVTGLGCQSHIDASLPSGTYTRTIQALARFGLPIHVSELDVSIVRAGRGQRRALEERQAGLYAEAMEAFMELPAPQRFAFTVWGLRDRDSWLKRENASDTPLLFDDLGRAKAAAAGLAAPLGALQPLASLYGNENRAT